MNQVRYVETLKKTVKFFEAVLAASKDGVLITDESAGILVANQSFCSVFDCSPGDLVETSLFDWLSAFEGDAVAHWTNLQNTVCQQGFCSNVDFELMTNDTPQVFSVNASSLDLETGQEKGPIALVSIWRDITLRKNAEAVLTQANALLEERVAIDRIKSELEKERISAELIKAKKMEAMGIMAGGVAHDLNNILTGIVGYPELILMKLPKKSELRKLIEAVRESGRKAATVVADLLAVARGAACIREVHNLNGLSKDYLQSPEGEEIISFYPNIIFKQQFEAKRPTILCSPVHVGKCLMNLVANAAEAIGAEVAGTVVVSTQNQYVDGEMSAAYALKMGEYIVLTVQDTGPGISDADLERIFEPFYTRKAMGRSGTGLGLTVVWNTMRDHDGKVLVESSDAGTCFELYFPLNREKGVIQVEEETRERFVGQGERILLVDDEPQSLDVASGMLVSLGYKVDTACSGEQALAFVQDQSVDVLVVDMLMEPGMNGRQTYEEILKLYPDQKALIVSGFSENDDVKATLRLGAGGFVRKPYSMYQLGRAVNEVLKK
jgi:signal transduction histidine kinase